MADEIAVIQALAEARSRALVEKDTATLRRVLAEDFVYTNSQGAVLTREEYIERFVTPATIRWARQAMREVDIWLLGDHAVLTCVVHDVADFDGYALDAEFQSLFLYIRRAGEWQCLAGRTRNMVSD